MPTHAAWVRACHWMATVSVAILAFSGTVILMAHPRLYWGNVGNDLTPALVELPISRNYKHGGWDEVDGRTYDIFNQNGWGRSLHFLGAWLLVPTGACYLLAGVGGGHFRRRIVPLASPPTTTPHDYGTLQKWTYSFVVFVACPLVVVTGLSMSPAINAAYPFLPSMFGGLQSARTIHFAAFVSLVVFVVGHVIMVARTGFVRHMRAMTIGE